MRSLATIACTWYVASPLSYPVRTMLRRQPCRVCMLQVDGPSGGRGGGSSLSSPLVRGSVYQALATLSRRVPEVFQVRERDAQR